MDSSAGAPHSFRRHASIVLRLAGLTSLGVCAALVSCNTRSFNAAKKSSAVSSQDPRLDEAYWEAIRASRQRKLDAYIFETRREDATWFRDFPLGRTGVPAVVFRLFQGMSPELSRLWGEGASRMAKFGLGPHPYQKNYPFPMGIGWTMARSSPVNVSVLTCGACHIGRVVGPDNTIRFLHGAPNTQFDAHGFAGAVVKTVEHDDFNADNLRKALDDSAKNPFWLYGPSQKKMFFSQAIETATVRTKAPEIVKALKAKLGERSKRLNFYLKDGPYAQSPGQNIDGGNPGRLDPFSTGLALLSDPDKVGHDLVGNAPSMVDIMSVWRQVDRPRAQWDGAIVSPVHRNLAAELGIVGDPEELDLQNARRSATFLAELPPPPYPFSVSETRRVRGEDLFAVHCASCHAPGRADIFPLAQVGTDPNRAGTLTPLGRKTLRDTLIRACKPSEKACRDIAANDIVVPPPPAAGYLAHPLDGIWARAPYLHNGSLPTLMHLLVPELRTTPEATNFWRGNISYDTAWVGFEWRTDKAPNGFPAPEMLTPEGAFLAAAKFDTQAPGNLNSGHTGTYLRSDEGRWSSDAGTPEGQQTLDLLEYLKTF